MCTVQPTRSEASSTELRLESLRKKRAELEGPIEGVERLTEVGRLNSVSSQFVVTFLCCLFMFVCLYVCVLLGYFSV